LTTYLHEFDYLLPLFVERRQQRFVFVVGNIDDAKIFWDLVVLGSM
jgi:hypothetical protein